MSLNLVKQRSRRSVTWGLCSLVIPVVILLTTICAMTNGGLSAADTSCCDYRQKGPEVNNVRVLRHFQRPQGFSFSMYRNEAELERPSRLLAEQIVEYLTKDKMPPWPIAPESGPTPQAIYEIFPVAWSLKVVNIRRAILPALREEVIVTAHLAPKYFKAGVFPEGEWAQGQRVLTACPGKDLEHVLIVPTTSAAFHGHAVFLGMLFQQGQRKAI